MAETSATFEIDLKPGEAPLEGAGRMDFTKRWQGGMEGRGTGAMFSGGDPKAGAAGYVALERFEGSIDGHEGACLLQQFGTMSGGAMVLHYEVVPGSGSGGLAGLTGRLALEIVEGEHRVTLTYAL